MRKGRLVLELVFLVALSITGLCAAVLLSPWWLWRLWREQVAYRRDVELQARRRGYYNHPEAA